MAVCGFGYGALKAKKETREMQAAGIDIELSLLPSTKE